MNNVNIKQVLRRPEVCALTGLSYSTIHRLERTGTFPARRRLSPNAVGWLRVEVEAWVGGRGTAASDRDDSRATL